MEKIVLQITLSEDGKKYNIKASEGMSLNEMMFGVAAAIRCLIRDKVIPNADTATNMLTKYLTDSQFNEIED